MKKKNPNLCEVKDCYDMLYLKYYKHSVCKKHFVRDTEHSFLKKVFNIPEEEKEPQNEEKQAQLQ